MLELSWKLELIESWNKVEMKLKVGTNLEDEMNLEIGTKIEIGI